jgi:hypothetical protein
MPGDGAKTEAEPQALVDLLEHRRSQADNFAWTVPGLAIAGQAFLLTISLDPSTRTLGRFLAAVAGLILLVATTHFLLKQAFNFDMYEAVIEFERRRLGLPLLMRDELISSREFDARWLLADRRWSKAITVAKGSPVRDRGRMAAAWREHRPWPWWRESLVYKRRALDWWVFALVGFMAIDVAIAIVALLEWVCDLHPLGAPPGEESGRRA